MQNIFETGDIVLLKAGEEIWYPNPVGGTSSFQSIGQCKVKMIHHFDDYECGRRFHAQILDDQNLSEFKRAFENDRATIQKLIDEGSPAFDADDIKGFTNKIYVSEFDIDKAA